MGGFISRIKHRESLSGRKNGKTKGDRSSEIHPKSQEASFTKYKSHTLSIDHEQNSGALKVLPSVETKVHPRSSADLRGHQHAI